MIHILVSADSSGTTQNVRRTAQNVHGTFRRTFRRTFQRHSGWSRRPGKISLEQDLSPPNETPRIQPRPLRNPCSTGRPSNRRFHTQAHPHRAPIQPSRHLRRCVRPSIIGKTPGSVTGHPCPDGKSLLRPANTDFLSPLRSPPLHPPPKALAI